MDKRGQNTVEYVLLVVAVMAVMIPLLMPSGKYQTALQNALNQVTINAIQNVNSEIKF